MTFRAFLVGVLLLAGRMGLGQNYIYSRLSIAEGLLSNQVLCAWQDTTGYLWIGTQSGLQRFDGISMRTALNERVDQLLADEVGRVWIRSGSRVGTLNLSNFSVRYVPFEGSEEANGPSSIRLRKDDRGRVLLIRIGKNCQYYNKAKQRFSRNSQLLSLPDSLQVSDVVPDPGTGRYWILAKNDFGYWDIKTKSYHSKATSSDPLLTSYSSSLLPTSLFIDRKGRYWMAANASDGVQFLCFDRKKGKLTADTLGMRSPDNRGFFQVEGFASYEDTITLAYGENYFRGHHGRPFLDLRSAGSNAYGIHFNIISSVFEDREGILWIATDNGLFYTRGNRNQYTHILFSQEKHHSSVSDLLTDRDNRLWIGTWGRGTFLLSKENTEPEISRIPAFDSLGDAMQRVVAYCEDNEGNIWVACDQGRLIRYNEATQAATLYKPKGFGNSEISQITKDKQGYLWIGMKDGGLWALDSSKPVQENNLRKVHSFGGAVNRAVVANGNLWLAVAGKGLFVMDTRNGRLLETVDIRKAGSSDIAGVHDMLPVADTLILLAGEHLGSIDPRTYQVSFNLGYTGRLSGTQSALLRDRRGNVWVGGATGIYKLNLKTKVLTKYSQEDGLITIHHNGYIPERSVMMKNGRLAFGGNQHLVVFDPEEYQTSQRPPAVTITGFQLNNRYLPVDSLLNLDAIQLPYTHNSFKVDFAAISFAHRERVTYEYKMVGLDQDWNELTTGGQASYNFLPPGKYRFEVRVKNDQGDYSSTTTFLAIRIQPPFWKTSWFYLLMAAVTAGILYSLHRMRLQRLLHIEKVRNRLARDLHDDMGSTLSTINILSNIALQQKSLDEAKSKQYLSTISHSTHQMMEAMDDIVWSINPVNDSVAKIMARMKETAGAVLEPKQIDYRFETDPQVVDLPLSMEARREIFLIFKEALNNVVKYAECSLVQVKLARKGQELLLTVSDNGVGFSLPEPGSTVRGNGLRNMQIRAGNVKGKLSFVSELGKGTTIHLLIPIA